MAVTKQTYTVTPTWTAAQMAAIFRTAFIDAGLMTEWYDSYANSTVEHRILEIAYDGSKTYGKTYYWFSFFAADVYCMMATGWNATTHAPTGTAVLDYSRIPTTSLSQNSEYRLAALSSTTDASIIRYTSQANVNQSWFAVGQSGSYNVFTIQKPQASVRTWVDLGKAAYNGFLRAIPATFSSSGSISWNYQFMIGRAHPGGSALKGVTSGANSLFNQTTWGNVNSARYVGIGNVSNSITSNVNVLYQTHSTGMILPVGFSDANPAYSSNYAPVFHSLPYCLYTADTLPTDFGVCMHYANNTIGFGDKMIVTAGVEEWEVLTVANNTTITTGATPLFLARVV